MNMNELPMNKTHYSKRIYYNTANKINLRRQKISVILVAIGGCTFPLSI